MTVTGPNGFSTQLTGSATLSALAAGSYGVAANPVRIPGRLVDTLLAPTVDATQVQVTGGQQASDTVTYSVRPGSGRLWAPLPGLAQLYGLDPEAALDGGASANATVITLNFPDGGLLRSPDAIAFDHAGNAWVAVTFYSDLSADFQGLVELTPDQLAATGTVVPAKMLAGVNLADGGFDAYNPVTLAFAPNGDLWFISNQLNRVDAAALATATDLTVSASWTYPNALFGVPLAFDANGAMWVLGYGATAQAWAYAPSDVTALAAPSPALVASGDFGLGYSNGYAFDAQGTLWSANTFTGVVGYAASQAVDGGTMQTVSALTSPELYHAEGLAFDNAGDAWVVCNYYAGGGNGFLAVLTPEQLATPLPGDGGLAHISPAYGVPLVGDTFSNLAFDPPPAALPVYR